MEVSSLRDRRLVALFATLVIVGSGAVGAVISLEDETGYRGPAFSDAAFAPKPPEPHGTTDPPLPAAPDVVVVVAEDPRVDPPVAAPRPPRSSERPPLPTTPAPSEPRTGNVEVADVRPAPSRSEPPPRSDVVIASDPEPSDTDDEAKRHGSHEVELRAVDDDPQPPCGVDHSPEPAPPDAHGAELPPVDEPASAPSAPRVDDPEPQAVSAEPWARHDEAEEPSPAPPVDEPASEPSRPKGDGHGNAFGHAFGHREKS